MKRFKIIYIDSFCALLGSYVWRGPVLFVYNQSFSRFSAEHRYVDPDPFFLDKKTLIQNVKRYYKLHKRYYRYRFGIEDWQITYGDIILEAHLNAISDVEAKIGDFDAYFNYEEKKIIKLIKRIVRKIVIMFK